jgi:hypothetical protein
MTTGPIASTSASSATREDLIRTCELFDHPLVKAASAVRPRYSNTGAMSLVDYCLKLTLRYLEDEYAYDDMDETVDLPEDNVDEATRTQITFGDVLKAEMPWMEAHLKTRLLYLHSLEIEDGPLRLSDDSLKHLLGYHLPVDETDSAQLAPSPGEDWEEASDHPDLARPPSVDHLPLTLHPSPLTLLRLVPQLQALALTSLNLAYSTIPDLDKLVGAMPASLRALGLVGIRLTGKKFVGEAEWRLSLGILGRKLTVLRVSHVFALKDKWEG